MSNGSPPLGQAVLAMLAVLDDYLPSPSAGLPEPSLALATLSERPVGIGNRRGSESRTSFGLSELKGVQLDARVRFQLWADDLTAAQAAASDLNGRLLDDRDSLWSAGVLRLALQEMPPAEEVDGDESFSAVADYRVLYEFRYQDSDGAESLIASIPIEVDLEEQDSPDRETTVVTDEMVRWDEEAAPPLRLQGRISLGRISAIAFIPPGPVLADGVTVTRTFDGAVGEPVAFASLAAFLDGVAGPDAPERHARTTFASLADFLDALGTPGLPASLGDWDSDGVTDVYETRSLQLEPRIELPGVGDRLEIAYGADTFDQTAVVYLRATRS